MTRKSANFIKMKNGKAVLLKKNITKKKQLKKT